MQQFALDKANPYPFYARLRAAGAVHLLDWPGFEQAWVVTRHREGLAALKDPRLVRSRENVTARDEDAHARPDPQRGFGRDLLELDPPDHTRLRKLVSKAFTSRMVDRLDTRIEQLAGGILERATARGEIELISEYASVIPITIISEMLGLPIADIGKFRAFVYALIRGQMLGQREIDLDREKARFTADLQAAFESRRTSPRDDLITALVDAEQDGDRLSPDELIGMVYLLLIAGFLTTVNLIGNGTLTLLRHREQLEILRRKPALYESAIEELLRFDGPLELSSVSYAASDFEMGGQIIPRGAPVRVLLPSANRDESVFADPDSLNVARDPNPHLSFGQGIHYCLGAPLARLEGRIAIRMLIERAPGLRIADPYHVKWQPHPILRGLQQLPLQF